MPLPQLIAIIDTAVDAIRVFRFYAAILFISQITHITPFSLSQINRLSHFAIFAIRYASRWLMTARITPYFAIAADISSHIENSFHISSILLIIFSHCHATLRHFISRHAAEFSPDCHCRRFRPLPGAASDAYAMLPERYAALQRRFRC
jgi:hypothetical protein